MSSSSISMFTTLTALAPVAALALPLLITDLLLTKSAVPLNESLHEVALLTDLRSPAA